MLAVALAFGRSVTYGFVNWDDPAYVSENEHVLHGLSGHEVVWAFTNLDVYFWIPLVWISYMVDSQLFGSWAGGYHLTNVLLHGATAIGLFLALRRMTGAHWTSALAAALFAIHPLRAESVAWVTERKDVLSGFFFVLTLLAYTAYSRRPFSLLRYLAVVVCFLMSLMAKPVGVTLPAVLLLLDIWPLGRFARSGHRSLTAVARLVIEKIPLFALAAISCVLTFLGAKRTFAAASHSWLARISDILASYAIYVGRAIWPVGLAPAHSRGGEFSSAWLVAVATVVLFGVTWVVIRLRNRCPFFLLGWFWYLVMLFPTSSTFSHGLDPRPDRHTYLPQIGLAIVFAWGAAMVFRAFPARRRLGVCTLGLILACLFAATWRQTGFWADSETLWTRSVAVSPDNARAHLNCGIALAQAGRTAEAIEHYRSAIRLKPDDARPYFDLGLILANLGRTAEAMENYELAIRHNRDYVKAHDGYADLLLKANRFSAAIEHFTEIVRITPDDPTAHNNLGQALLKAGRVGEAVESCERAARLGPGQPVAEYNLGRCLAKAGRGTEALRHLEQSLRLAQESGQKQLARAVFAEIQQLPENKP